MKNVTNVLIWSRSQSPNLHKILVASTRLISETSYVTPYDNGTVLMTFSISQECVEREISVFIDRFLNNMFIGSKIGNRMHASN